MQYVYVLTTKVAGILAMIDEAQNLGSRRSDA